LSFNDRPSVTKPYEFALAAHPLDIERVTASKRQLVRKQKHVRSPSVRDAFQCVEHLPYPLLVAPGAYDVLSAKIIENAGFQAVYMTGYGTSASILGEPDVGLLTMGEMARHAANIAACGFRVKPPTIPE